MSRKPKSTRCGAHDLDDAAIHHAIQVVSYLNYINRVADAAGIEDELDWD